MKLFRALGCLFPRKQRWKLAGLLVLQWLEALLEFFGISLILPFVALLLRTETLHEARWYRLLASLTDGGSRSVLLLLTLLMMGVYVVKNLYLLFLTDLRTRVLSTDRIRVGAELLSCYMHKPYTFHLQRNTAQIIRSVNGDAASVFHVLTALLTLISDALLAAMLTVYLLLVDVWLTVGVLLALLLCSAVYFLLVRKKLRAIGIESRKCSARMIQAVQQSMGGIKEVKVMGTERYFVQTYIAAGEAYVRRQRRYQVISAVPRRLLETVCICTILGVLSVRIAAGGALSLVVPSLSAFAVAAIRLLPRVDSINGCINAITYHFPALRAVYDELKTVKTQPETARSLSAATTGDIVLKKVAYTYPEQEKPVLRNVDLSIPRGTTVGIIGATGAGKTTLVDIILGLLKPEAGTVCCGTMDICNDPARWQRHLGYIPQSIYLTDDTIRSNVALGVEPEQTSDEAVWKALERAQLAAFVRELKDGLDTPVGERGVRLSGGQRQRIGIARALYHDPEVLIFDEATSALDNETEAAVLESIRAMDGGKTILLVAHRLTTLRGCDEIYRVENGGVERTTLEMKWKNL